MKICKLALIHDLCGIGHCSMTVALPIVSVMGIQGCPVPTSIFSNHTGYPEWYKEDFTGQMVPYLNTWDKLQVALDGIYCGYLGSGVQCKTVLALVKKHKDACFFLDPVMGDHGKLYHAITAEHITAMKQLAAHAQCIIPNITEACVLTDTPYKTDFSQKELSDIAEKLHILGPAQVVITGIRKNDFFINHVSEAGADGPKIHLISTPSAGTPRPGTGDIFASVLVSCILKGQPLTQSVQKAAQFVSDCIQISDACNLPVQEGTCFELVLPSLLEQPAL